MQIPNWYQILILSLAAFRIWHLMADDLILDRPRRWLLRLGEWRTEGDRHPENYRRALGEFLVCPWCLGFWIALIVWGAFQWSPHWSMVMAAPWAISAIVGLVGSKA